MKFEAEFGATPLDEDEKAFLIPKHIQTMEELNAFEHANIVFAEQWALKSHFELTLRYLKKLHRKMYEHTWGWAGKFRKTQKNIGIEAYRLESEIKLLCDDVLFQIQNNSFSFEEIAARFHHRLVFIHAFPNGNGRHARLATDLLLIKNGQKRFTWGYNFNRNSQDLNRKAYIEALQKADQHNILPLLEFVQS